MSIGVDFDCLVVLYWWEVEWFIVEWFCLVVMFEYVKEYLYGGVLMLWMVKWFGLFLVFVESVYGVHFICVDGIDYVDLCFGDIGVMVGYLLEVIVVWVCE